MDKRTPEIKLIMLMEEQMENLKGAYDNFKTGQTDIFQAALYSEQIGIALTEQSKAILDKKIP
jgi:hypothetical protein